MHSVIAEINDALAAFAPEHVRDPRKAMFRIYRDTRFSSDKRPYKDHVGVWWGRGGLEKTSGAGFYFHIGPKEVIAAAGAYMATPDQLLAIRRHIDANHEEVRHTGQPQAAVADERVGGRADEARAQGLPRGLARCRTAEMPQVGPFGHTACRTRD